MFKTYLLVASILFISISCQDDEPKFKLTDYTTFFGPDDNTYHTGYFENTGYIYKRNNTGKVRWKMKLEHSIDVNNKIIVLADGSCLVFNFNDGEYYFLTTDGSLIWKKQFEMAAGTPFIDDGTLYLPSKLDQYTGLLSIDLETGNELSRIELEDFPNETTSWRMFSYYNNAFFVSAVINNEFVRIAKIKDNEVEWVEDNKEQIPSAFALQILHHQEGFSILFDENITYQFSDDGIFKQTKSLNNFNYFSLFIPNINNTHEIVSFDYTSKKLTWVTYNNELNETSTVLLPLDYNNLSLCNYKIINEGILISIFITDTSPPAGQKRLLLKPDGTYSILL